MTEPVRILKPATGMLPAYIEALERGTPPWVKPWSAAADPQPINATTRRPYRGVNFLTLQLHATAQGYARNVWMTYRQAGSVGAQVRKGERGALIVFWQLRKVDARVETLQDGTLGLTATGLGRVVCPAPAGAQPGISGAFAIRPEQVRIGAPGDHADLPNRFAGTLRDSLYVGDVSTYKVELDSGVLVQALLPNSAPGRMALAPGDRVGVAWPADAGMFLNE